MMPSSDFPDTVGIYHLAETTAARFCKTMTLKNYILCNDLENTGIFNPEFLIILE